MKKSEVIKELLDSYSFQWGKRANLVVARKANRILESFKKEEEKLEVK